MESSLGTLIVPVVPQIDKDALKRLSEEIRVAVAQAVRDGINDAQLVEAKSEEAKSKPVKLPELDGFDDPSAFDAKLKEHRTT